MGIWSWLFGRKTQEDDLSRCCPECGLPYSSDSTYCDHCGYGAPTHVSRSQAPTPVSRSQITVVDYFRHPTTLADYDSVRLSRELFFEPGLYAWYFDEVPVAAQNGRCCRVGKWTLLYVGIAKTNLRDRILAQHFSGNAASSTLRLTLGCLLADRLSIQLYKTGKRDRWTFGRNGEKRLSLWMREHARVAWVRISDNSFEWPQHDGDKEGDIVKRVEETIIDKLWLPLNLDRNRAGVCGKVKAVRRKRQNSARHYEGDYRVPATKTEHEKATPASPETIGFVSKPLTPGPPTHGHAESNFLSVTRP